MERRGLIARLSAVLIAGAVLLFLYRNYLAVPSSQRRTTLKVLSYSSFLNSWGPGREIALAFERETGIAVEYQDAGDAGLLLKKLELFPSDVVVGLDQLLLPDARTATKWRSFTQGGARNEPEFLAFDYSPMTFIYRKDQLAEADVPVSIDDLADRRFTETISLQDPRTSTPGLQFLFWMLDRKGIDEGFAYLAKLKPSVRAVSPSWSGAYGLFTHGQAKLVFSYLTSPLYHSVSETDDRYKAVLFNEALPVQIEYAGVPAACGSCEAGEQFARYLVRPEIQKLIMTKNYMLPVDESVRKGTPFETLPRVDEYRWRQLPELVRRREEIFERWRKLGLG